MNRRYIRRGDKQYPEQIQKTSAVGVVVSFFENGVRYLGWSILNPKDAEEVVEYNKRVKRANSESFLLKSQGRDFAPVEEYRPLFDKNEAVKLAKQNAKPADSIDFSVVPSKVRKSLLLIK